MMILMKIVSRLFCGKDWWKLHVDLEIMIAQDESTKMLLN